VGDPPPGRAHQAGSKTAGKAATFGAVITQIVVIDMVFSLDSVITAVGMAHRIEVMIAAVVIAVAVMMLAAEAISGFIRGTPTLKVLALAFLVLIGVLLDRRRASTSTSTAATSTSRWPSPSSSTSSRCVSTPTSRRAPPEKARTGRPTRLTACHTSHDSSPRPH
jgi:hypothetical protein